MQATIEKASRIIMQRCDLLARFSALPDAIFRSYLSPEHAAANRAVMGWMNDAGMTSHQDAVGNVIGRIGDKDAPALVIGSHLDTVPDAGKYDGILGVMMGLALVEVLKELDIRPEVPIEVMGFGDEEGVRFGKTLMTSHAIAGKWDEAWLTLRDNHGETLRDAMRNFGLDPEAAIQAAKPQGSILAFLEPHIEQGPVLEDAGLPVGVVTAIAGATRMRVNITGAAAHAGTTPMNLRRDALAGAAEMITYIEKTAQERPIVATVGTIDCMLGATNVVPREIEFSLDLRSEDDHEREAAIADVVNAMTLIAARRQLGFHSELIHEVGAVACDTNLQQHLATAIEAWDIPTLHMPSGAGHDAMAIASICPAAMLFIRCEGGVSHNSLEAITVEDVEYALAVMVNTYLEFSREQQSCLKQA